MTTIYVFSDQNCFPVYIGKTKDLKRRTQEHIYGDRFKYDTWFYRWLNSQIRKGLPYYIDILEVCDDRIWQEREQYWITHVKENGFLPTNMTDGGDGNNNQVFSPETIEKRRKKLIGQRRTPDQKRRMSEARKGWQVSEETKKKLSFLNKGKPCPQETREKLSRPVVQLDRQGNFVAEYKSVTEAAIKNTWRKGSISNALNGRCPTFKGYKWQFK